MLYAITILLSAFLLFQVQPIIAKKVYNFPVNIGAREAVARLGATLVRARHFEDNVLLDDADSTLVGSGRTLRLRRTDGSTLLTFKGPRRDREGVKSRQEIEVAASDADALQASIDKVRQILQSQVSMIPALKATIAHFADDRDWQTVRPPLVELALESRALLVSDLVAAGFDMPGLKG